MDRSILDLLPLPDVPRVVYEHPPLALVLCQLRFPTVLAVASPVFVAGFQRQLQDSYPLAGPVGMMKLEIEAAGAQPEIRKSQTSQQWRFADQTDTWSIVLAQDSIALETRVYEDFADFLNRLQRILAALIQHIGPTAGTRLGLRYINEIRPGHEDWATIIPEQFLGPLGVRELRTNAQSVLALQEFALRYPGDQGVTIRHGAFPQGTTVRPRPGEEAKDQPFYLLDFDVYREFRPPTLLPMDTNVICRYVEQYNRAIYRLFRWSTRTEFTSTLGVRHVVR